MATATASSPQGLERNAIGLTEVLFQSITHMAPAAAVAFSIIVGVPYAGGAIPLAVLLALIACLLVAISVGQLARHLPSAGGLYTYSSRGLGAPVGFLVAWGFMLAEPLVAPLLYLIFGNELAANLNSHFGWPLWLWAPFAALAGLIVWGLTYRGEESRSDGIRLGLEIEVLAGGDGENQGAVHLLALQSRLVVGDQHAQARVAAPEEDHAAARADGRVDARR